MMRWPNIVPQEHRRVGPLILGEALVYCILYTGPFVRICQQGDQQNDNQETIHNIITLYENKPQILSFGSSGKARQGCRWMFCFICSKTFHNPEGES